MFSKACEYAIRAVLYIANKSKDGARLSIRDIAREIASPEPFTAKILQALVRNGIVSSIKGPNGGFFLKPNAKPVSLHAIVMAVDGEEVLHSCALGLKECDDKFPCPIHKDVKAYKTRFREILHEKTVQDLAADLESGNAFLRNGKTRTRR